MFQEAMFHSAGECSSVLLVSVSANEAELSAARSALLARAARLMGLLEEQDKTGAPLYGPDNLYLLVAVANRLLPAPDAPAFTEFPAEGITVAGRTMQRGDGSADLLVQVSAPTETDRRYALRLALGILQGHAAREGMPPSATLVSSEVHGARIFSGLEPFGYRDAAPSESEGLPPALMTELRALRDAGTPPAQWIDVLRARGRLPRTPLLNDARAVEIFQRALADEAAPPNPLKPRRNPTLPRNAAEQTERQDAVLAPLRALAEGDVWLLFQRFEHKLDDLTNINPAADIGKAPVGGSIATGAAPANSHLAVAQADLPTVQRRGFAYRNERGAEGLVFIGLTSRPDSFRESLVRHLESDRLFNFTNAVSSGIYRVPRSAQALADEARVDARPAGSDPIPPPARQLLRPRREGGRIPRLVNYQVIPEVIQYVQLARASGLFLEPTMELNPSAETALQAFEASLGVAELATLRERIREQSEVLYDYNGGYFTLSI